MESEEEDTGFYYNSDLGAYVDPDEKSYYHAKLKMFFNPSNGLFYDAAGAKFDPKNQVCISKTEVAFERESGSLFNIKDRCFNDPRTCECMKDTDWYQKVNP